MEKLTRKWLTFKQVHTSFVDSMEVYQTIFSDPMRTEKFTKTVVAGVIQHFEMTYETCWKLLQEYMKKEYGLEFSSPRTVFKAAYERSVVTEEMLEALLDLTGDRNMTVHVYNRALADEVMQSIEDHYKVFQRVIDKLSPQLSHV